MGRSEYFTIDECKPEEIEQLQFRLYTEDEELIEDLTEEEKEIVHNADLPSDIPFKIVKKVFDYVTFVNEDFFCNME